MRPRAQDGVRAALLLGTVLLAGCLTVPDPPGARRATEHYEIRADAFDPALVTSAALLAERDHRTLGSYFGRDVAQRLPVIVCSDAHAFAHYRRRAAGSAPAVGFYSCSPSFAVISGDQAPREQVLAHELVHHFVHNVAPEMPFWLDEGLACELSHTHSSTFDPLEAPVLEAGLPRARGGRPRRALGHPDRVACRWPAAVRLPRALAPLFRDCPILEVSSLSDARIAKLVASLPSWAEDDREDGWVRSQVAAALVRFGMETQGWRDLRDAAAFRPDAAAFIHWLRGSPTHDRFPALVGPTKI